MSRCCRVLLVALVVLGVAAPSAGAVPDKKLGDYLGAMWKTALETPTPQNPFTPADPPNSLCVDLGGVVAPFAGTPVADFTCTVKPGTKIFVAAWSAECSTLEVGTIFFGKDEPALRECAAAVNKGIELKVVSLDGKPIATTEVQSPLIRLNLPTENIFGAAPGTGPTSDGLPYISVADGFVALLHPLTPGTHEIKLTIGGAFPPGTPLEPPISNTTTIIVKPGL